MTENGKKDYIPIEDQAGAGIFRDRNLPLESVWDWLKLNTETARGILKDIASQHGVEADLEPIVGMYLGDAEPSFALILTGSVMNKLGVIAEWGKCHSQKAMVYAFKDENGKGFRADISLAEALLSEKKDQLLSFMRESKLSGMIVTDEAERRVVGVKYWGQGEVQLGEVRDIVQYLRSITEIKVTLQIVSHYTVGFIEEVDYDSYIRNSKQGRQVNPGECLNRYTPLS